jgi:glycosyltransferase involved in cell wall biosynthesis
VKQSLHFAIPGDIDTLTGGYGYDRRLCSELLAAGMAIEVLPLSGKFPAPDAAAVADAETKFAALKDAAIVLVDGLALGVLDTLAKREGKRLKLIALCHHPLALETGLTREQARALLQSEQRALQAATGVIVTSATTGRVLTEQFNIAADKITVAQPGTDAQQFAACHGDPPVLLTVATLTRRKAHDVLIAALARIAHLPWTARFVGGAGFEPEWTDFLRQQVAVHGLEQRIHFVGAVADPAGEYAGADLFVLPSLFEGYGMAFAEALAFGLPVVGARAGAVPDVVPASAGLLVEPGAADALAAALAKLLEEPALRGRLQRGARRAAAHLPTWQSTAQTVAALVTRVAAA